MCLAKKVRSGLMTNSTNFFERIYLDRIHQAEELYADLYSQAVCYGIQEEETFLVRMDHLKQAFYLLFAQVKSSKEKLLIKVKLSHCLDILSYGIEHYPDSGFQEMKHNFEEWIKENQCH
mgnify:CR=1 FL=1